MLMRIAMFYFLVHSVGYFIAFDEVLIVVALAMIAMMLPISVAGIGVREGVIVFLLYLFHVPYESATVVALLSRLFLCQIVFVDLRILEAQE